MRNEGLGILVCVALQRFFRRRDFSPVSRNPNGDAASTALMGLKPQPLKT